jgi:selenium-binding protein 1
MGTVVEENNSHGCCKSGPGYATPLEAMSGPRETLIYVTAVYSGNISNINSFFVIYLIN